MTEHQTTTDRLGTVETSGDQVTLRYQRRLAHPPEKVWRALTESEHLEQWFPADIVGERRAGAPLRFPFWPRSVSYAGDELAAAGVDLADPVLPGELLNWDPPRLFEFHWDSDHLRFELTPDGDGTQLSFATTVTVGAEGPRGIEGTCAGYHVCLDALAQTLDTGTADQPDPAVITALEERYRASITTS